jgi:hypothetical protein
MVGMKNVSGAAIESNQSQCLMKIKSPGSQYRTGLEKSLPLYLKA